MPSTIPRVGPAARVLLIATALASLLEIEGILRTGAWPGDAAGSTALVLATLSLNLSFCGLFLLLARLPRVLLGARLPTPGPLLLKLAGGTFFVGALASHIVDTTLYVRLYPAIHLALGLCKICSITWAVFWLVAARRAPSVPGRAGLLTCGAAILLALPAAHLVLGAREDARAVLLGHGSAGARLGRLLSAASDLDGDGYGWLMTHADVAPLDPTVSHPSGCDIKPTTQASASTGKAGPLSSSAANKRSFVLVVVDALRADHALGTDLGRQLMPVLNQVATFGTSFKNTYAAASWTMPSIYSLMSGRWPWAVAWVSTSITVDNKVIYRGVPTTWPRIWAGAYVATPASDRHPTLAELFTRAGYKTGVFPVQENLLKSFGLTRGFADYDNGVWKRFNKSGNRPTGDHEVTRALHYIKAAAGQPFFTFVHLYDAHNPYLSPHSPQGGDTPLDRYRAALRSSDRQLGRLIHGLQQLGVAGSTILAVTGDHGEEFGDHGGGHHGTSLYEELIRVPMLVAGPDIPRRQVDAPISLIDLAPTLVELAGLPPQSTFQGQSLLPLMRGQPQPARTLFSETVYKGIHEQYAAILGRHKLIWDRPGGYRELFDLQADPAEMDNLIERDEVRAASLMKELCAALATRGGLAVNPRGSE